MPKLSASHKALIRRYLTWAYKSTKESFDRLERKTTQLLADEYIWTALHQDPPKNPPSEYESQLAAFKDYISKKKQQPVSEGEYCYLQRRLQAVESAVRYFLGAKELKSIQERYEREFVRRIWEAREH